MNPAILIFGAGVNQLELIREARSLGITTIVIDPQQDPPGRPEADHFYMVGGSDYELTRSIAIKHNVKGIVTGQTEKPLKLMARLADDLGFIFNSPEVTDRCIDKWLMKEAFMKGNVSCASGILVRAGEKIPRKLPSNLTFPLIIKPRDAFSSRGVYRCETVNELGDHLEESRRWSSNGDILLEEFLEGKEYSVEAVTFKGKTTIIQFTEKFITPYPNTVETGHLQPAGLTGAERESVSLLVKGALQALGVENSASHTEVMLTKEGPKVIETGARLGGDFISSYLTKASTGVSMDRAAIQVSLGMIPELNIAWNKYAMIKYLELPAGRTVKQITSINEVYKVRNIIFAFIFVKPGDIIKPLTHSALRPACCLATGDTREEVLNNTELGINRLKEIIQLT